VEEFEAADSIPEAVTEEALSAWTIHVADSLGGPSAFQVVVEDGDLSVNTVSEGIAWRPVDQVLGGDFEVSARFEPRDQAGVRYAYGIIVGGKNLPDPDRAYTFFRVNPDGEHQIGRVQGAMTTTLLDWKSVEEPRPEGREGGAEAQQLSVRVLGEQVEFLLNETVVATLPRSEAQPHGLAGIQVGADASVAVHDWEVNDQEVSRDPR
jgi:hypothetical protein